jgi:hypothetical protein
MYLTEFSLNSKIISDAINPKNTTIGSQPGVEWYQKMHPRILKT